MPRLVVARKEQVDAIYRESHAVWGAGLTPAAYRDLWDDISHTPWARRWARFYVLLDQRDTILSSLKLYRPLVRYRGVTARCSVLSAIFTPRRHRQRGHARRLVEAALAAAAGEGASLALLFSDIGEAYYRSMGFRTLPAEEQSASLRHAAGFDDRHWLLRPMEDRDLDDVVRAHDAFVRGRPFGIVRDAEHWQFLLTRSARFFARLCDDRVEQRFRIATHRGKFAGYLMTSEGRGEWNVREIGAAGGDPGRMVDVLRAGAAEARRSRLRRFTGWLPPEVVEELRGWRVRVRARRQAVPMVRSLEPGLDLAGLDSASRAFIPYQDQF